jgi:peptidoglycan/LPS O-acetylase OafA/YrhL
MAARDQEANMATSTTPSRTDTPAAAPLAAPRSEPRLDTRAWLQGPISGVLAAFVGISWYALFALSAAIEPESSHEVPVIGLVLGVALLAAMLATGIGLASRRRWGLVAALGASVLLLASAVACPTTGHHTIGTWWYFQMACSFAAVGLTTVALRRS